jgi:uncharacterized protein YdhG (YjbR/CyaY superfamily)
MRAKTKSGPKTIDQYLARLPADKRCALEKLRKDIRAAAPGVEECISYGVCAFRLDGRMCVAFGAALKHCAFYPGAVIQDFMEELARYDTSKGTIRFAADKPLPAALVRKLVKCRVARHAQRSTRAAKGSRRKRSS